MENVPSPCPPPCSHSVTGGWGFQYDAFNRLAGINSPSITWVYDRFGNRWQQNSTVGGPQPQYTFDSNNHISGSGVVYDALGNVVNDEIGDAYTYDAENRIIAMTNGSNTYNYIYDALGRRVAMKENGVLADEFLYDLAGHKVVSFDGSGDLVAQEFYAGNRHLATYLASTNQMYFHHTDWLGTVRIDTDANGNQAQICYSWPFGDNRSCNGVFTSANLFTDLFLDPDNSVHAQFRQLSTTQGRWLSPDPAGVAAADLTNPQSLNLYAYVLNNPLRAVDPLGLECVWDDGSFDSADDAETGNWQGCQDAGGTWFDPGWFAGQGLGDWSPNGNSDLAGLVDTAQNGMPDATVTANLNSVPYDYSGTFNSGSGGFSQIPSLSPNAPKSGPTIADRWPFNGNLIPGTHPQDGVCTTGPLSGPMNSDPLVLACCQAHDNCYAQHQCNASSWLPLIPGSCSVCNIKAVACINQAVPPVPFVP